MDIKIYETQFHKGKWKKLQKIWKDWKELCPLQPKNQWLDVLNN